MAKQLCMVCGKRPAVALYRDPLGWYLIGCSDRRCIAPLGCEHYDYAMSLVDFLACRRMIAANRYKAMTQESGSGQGVLHLGSAVEQRRQQARRPLL